MPSDPLSHLQSQRRFIRERAKELLARVGRMDDEELRWTVRVFADCLSSEQRKANLGSYSEHWPIEKRRTFVPTFIRQYTDLALEELKTKERRRGSRLAQLTEEELQSMPLAEKWHLLARDPGGLWPDQLRRELARLFMCKSFDLFHDPGLSEAAVEFPAYHQVREALERQPDAIVHDLTQMVLLRTRRLDEGTPQDVEIALAEVREAIGRALGILIPVDQLFHGQMVKLPLQPSEELSDFSASGAYLPPEGLAADDLATAFLVLTDLMNLREWDEYLLPLRRRYRSITEIPPRDLDILLPQLWRRLVDRRITDFAERYRSGRMMAERKVDPGVWNILPPEERLTILDRDNRTMDVVQAIRHLAKIFFSFQYPMLFDVGFHTDLLRSPGYQEMVNRLIVRFPAGADREADRRPLEALTQTVTRQMLQLEALPPDERARALQEVRTMIATALGLPGDLTYPASKEGRA